jgi:Ca2+-transporting ATPase
MMPPLTAAAAPAEADRARGLSHDEAARRLAVTGPNELPSARPRNLVRIGRDVAREPMLLLLIATGATYLALGDFQEALALVGAIGLVLGVTIYQEQKTERTLAALRDLSSPRALVIRDGTPIRIAGREVVPGDLVIISEGDRVPADALLLSTSNLVLDEALLTGESVPVRKHLQGPEPDRSATVYSGTLVVGGHGTAAVFATGAATELGRIGTALAHLEIAVSSLQVEVRRMVRTLAILGLAVCASVGVLYGINRGRWLDGALAGLTTAISMIPEEFPVVLTIFLALGAWRISRSHVLTRRVPAIETLGAATVLCVDKTGTLTLNQMAVAQVWAANVLSEFSEGKLGPPAREVVEFAMLSSKQEPFDPMERAFLRAAAAAGIHTPKEEGWTLCRDYPMSDALLAVAQVWAMPSGLRKVAAVKGAPEAIIELCGLNASQAAVILAAVDNMARGGLRVLGVARAAIAHAAPESARGYSWNFLGLIGLADPIREGVREAIAECYAAGIRVVMLTGDYQATALHIARQIGLHGSDRCLTGADLARLREAEFARVIQEVNVFARIVPDQKLRLVTALKQAGDVVAMTGDGVNDAPALKAAHIGIAMGRKGTDVAREAAALVLMDDDFTSIVQSVRIGRRIYDNIRKAMSYVLAIHVPIAGVSLIPALLGQPLIILPLHLIFMELIVDPACSVAFEMEPEEADVMRRPPRSPGQPLFERHLIIRSLAQGVGALLTAVAMFAAALHLGLAEPVVRTLTFSTLVIGNLALIFTNRSMNAARVISHLAPNPALRFLTSGALLMLGIVLYVPAVSDLFRLARPSAPQLGACLAAGLVTIVWVEAVKAVDLLLTSDHEPISQRT